MSSTILKNLKTELVKELEKDLYVSDISIVDKLIEDGYLSADDWESIRALHRPTKKVKQLMNCLAKTIDPVQAYRTLCKCLDTSHKHLSSRVKYVLDEYDATDKQRNWARLPSDGNIPESDNNNDGRMEDVPRSFQSRKGRETHGDVSHCEVEGDDIDDTSQKAVNRCSAKTSHIQLVTSCICEVFAKQLGYTRKCAERSCHDCKSHHTNADRSIQTNMPSTNCELTAEASLKANTRVLKPVVSGTSSSGTSSSTSTESEVNTDIGPADLNHAERHMYDCISHVDDNLSDYMDRLVEQGAIDLDDVESIKNKKTRTTKTTGLAHLICKALEERKTWHCESMHSGLETEAFVDKLACPLEKDGKTPSKNSQLYKYPATELRVLDNIFDILNDKVNSGSLDIQSVPNDLCEAAVTYHLQACDMLHHGNFDDAEHLIEMANSAADQSDIRMQLKGEIFTSKTWLYFDTGRYGKMLELLKEFEAVILFLPGVWSNTACGWFYYDLARCLQKMSELGHGDRHSHAKRYSRNQAFEYARKSLDYFKQSSNSDGPIGVAFAASLMLDNVLGVSCRMCSSMYTKPIRITPAGIRESEQILEFIEAQFEDGMPPVYEVSYLMNKCDLCYRKGCVDEALPLAETSLRLSTTLDLQEMIPEAKQRVDILQKVIYTRTSEVRSAMD